MTTARHIHNSIYTRRALASTREVYNAYCDVRVRPEEDGRVEIVLTVKPEFREQARQVILEFWNYFLDLSCQQHLSVT